MPGQWARRLSRKTRVRRSPAAAAANRRVRLLAITAAGRRVRTAVQAEIQANEDRVLSRLPAADRRAFLRAAEVLSSLPREGIAWPGASRSS
jgi:DNA-binding MarR family transcriptional regulator